MIRWMCSGTSPAGVFGRDAFTGGSANGSLGNPVSLCYRIPAGQFFFIAASRIAPANQNWFVSGVAYGVVVYWEWTWLLSR